MNKNSSDRKIGVLALLAALSLSCGWGDRGQSSGAELVRDLDLTAEGVRRIIEESPNDYLAAVQEVVDDSDCYGEKDGSGCLLQVRVVEYLGGNPDRPLERQQGWIYHTIEMRIDHPWPNRAIGRRRLVLAIPHPSASGVYGNRMFVVDPSSEEIATLRRLLDAV